MSLESVARTVAAELLRFGAELGAGIIQGAEPNAEYIAKELVRKGVRLVGAETLRGYLSAEAAHRIDAEVDAEMERKLRGA